MEEQKHKDDRPNPEAGPDEERRGVRGFNLWILLIFFALAGVWLIYSLTAGNRTSEVTYSYFLNLIDGKDPNGNPIVDEENQALDTNIEFVLIEGTRAKGTFKVAPPQEARYKNGKLTEPKSDKKLNMQFEVGIHDQESAKYNELIERLKAKEIRYQVQDPPNLIGFYSILFFVFSIVILIVMFLSLRRAQNQMMGGGGFLSSFSRSTAKKYEAVEKPITFDDVAGLEGTKKDLAEIVEFLRDPQKFQKLGGRVPKGALLIGPPGTGKNPARQGDRRGS